jgi:hypothetical protein
VSPASHAAHVLVDFDVLADNTVLSNQVAGLTFTNAAVMSAGVGLNEVDSPPFSSANVAYDSGGNLIISGSPARWSLTI